MSTAEFDIKKASTEELVRWVEASPKQEIIARVSIAFALIAGRQQDAQAILDRIDSTADGVKVLPGDRIWHPLDDGVTSVDWNEEDGYYGIRRSPDECCEHCKRGTFWKRHKVSEFYSTQELAKKARAELAQPPG